MSSAAPPSYSPTMVVDRAENKAAAPRRNVLTIRELGHERLVRILRAANGYLDTPPEGDELRGRSVGLLFFEDSTRTRVSFTAAAQRLGAHVLDLASGGSSMSKGETIADTARTVAAIGVDAMVVRSRQAGGPGVAAAAVSSPVISAGDGRHAHPTQGMIDVLAFARFVGRADAFDLAGLRVAIVGDVLNSRVARSAVEAFSLLGASVVVVGPPAFAPPKLAALGCDVSNDLDAELASCDSLMMLRVQVERHGGAGAPPGYRRGYALTSDRLAKLRPSTVVMHPGPMNRGVEIDGEAADGARSLITEQVRCGVATRMATLVDVINGASEGGAP
ncbi:MAG: aspartate carbamoyltransferase [Phycisphaerae bacterium]|nr:aspartate carbamoyltransferase [Phycisphaerae bacterium]